MGIAIPSQPLRPPQGRIGRLLHNERLILGLAGIVVFLAAWELGSRAGMIDRSFFGRPTGIVEAGIKEVQTPRFWGDFYASVTEFGIGYLLAILLGVPIGLAAGRFRRLQYALDPWLNFFNSLPRIALLPVLVIMFGVFGPGAKIAVVFLGAFFSIVIPTMQGVRTVDRRYVDVARSFDASERLLFRSVVIPSTVPFIITGLRLGIARALIGVVTAELYTQTEGIGVLIRRATELRQGDRALFGVLIFTVSGIVGVEAIRRVEARFQKWRPMTSLERR
ncbi:MAG TPA: ABC transporter permease [Candidatus Limnocylindrales bacterium]|nr:ABC transporter permease [Candidatus Limnocylindrales bacterium]